VPTSPANRDYQPGFAGALMAKDLGLALNALESTGVAAVLGPLAAKIYRRFADEGGAGLDFSGIINSIRSKSDEERHRMTTYENILLERRGRVGLITLNRPQALNALNEALMRDVVAAATELDRDSEVGAIVITGSERAFAAGADIKEMATQSYMDMYAADWFAGWGALAAVRTPGDRRRRRARPRRRLRTGHDLRLHHRGGHRQVRAAGDQARPSSPGSAARSG